MTDEAMSPLRRRMIEDMTVRNFGPKTQHDYVRDVRNLTVFLGRSPDTATAMRMCAAFSCVLLRDGISAASMNSTVSRLRFFFRVDARPVQYRSSHLPFVRQPHKLPIVLSPGGGLAVPGRQGAQGRSTRPRSAPPMARDCASPRSWR